jgi:hypothetical protein
LLVSPVMARSHVSDFSTADRHGSTSNRSFRTRVATFLSHGTLHKQYRERDRKGQHGHQQEGVEIGKRRRLRKFSSAAKRVVATRPERRSAEGRTLGPREEGSRCALKGSRYSPSRRTWNCSRRSSKVWDIAATQWLENHRGRTATRQDLRTRRGNGSTKCRKERSGTKLWEAQRADSATLKSVRKGSFSGQLRSSLPRRNIKDGSTLCRSEWCNRDS